MNDFAIDGRPLETPLGAAAELEARTPPTFMDAFAAQFHDSSVTEPVLRWAERGGYMDTWSGKLARAFGQAGAAEAGGRFMPYESDLSPAPAPQLSAEEANAKYAPLGPDGKRAPIATGPLPEPVAEMIGKAKAAEIERQGVLARYGQAHSWPVTMGTGIAAFMLDPLNLASTFIPGVGEEALTARLGTGWAARTSARLVAGATAGAVSQIPVTGLRYALGQEEARDYSMRDAFRDVFYAAAGSAILHTGLRTLGDVLRVRVGAKLPKGVPSDASTQGNEALGQSAVTREEAMRAAVAQIVEGREVNVEPVLSEADAAQVAQSRADLARLEAEGYEPKAPLEPGRVSTAEELKGPPVEMVPTATPEELAQLKERSAQVEARFKLEGETEAQFRDRMLLENREREAARAREAAPPASEFTLAGSDRQVDQAAARGQMELGTTPATVAAAERVDAPRAPGIPDGELARIEREAYEPKEAEKPRAAPAPEVPQVAPHEAQRALDLAHEDANLIRLAGRCL